MNENIIEVINNDYLIEVANSQYDIIADNLINIDYTYSSNKPMINSVELNGNKSSHDFGLVDLSDMNMKEDVANKVVSIGNDSTDIEYPSAKCVQENFINVNNKLNLKLNCDMSNLSQEGQVVFDGKADSDLSNVTISQDSAVQSALNLKLDKTGGTLTGDLNFNKHSLTNCGVVELSAPSGSWIIGGCIDFHWNNSTADYTSRILEDENGKLNLICPNGLKINNSNSPYLKTTYINGTSGYNIRSDGFCEQWGYTCDVYTTSFIKTFRDTNYSLQISKVLGGNDASVLNITSFSSTSFAVSRGWNTNGAPGTFFWKASGYLASGQY